jgi:hypothetical protein
MNWEEVGAIGQVFGSGAVLATLGFLSIQVRDARQETRRALSQNRAEATRQLFMQANTEWLVRNFNKAESAIGGTPMPFVQELMDRAGMTNAEASSVHLTQQAFWAHQAQLVPFVDDLTNGERSEFDLGLQTLYGGASALTSLWYAFNKSGLNPDAVHYVDTLVARRW